VKAGEVVLEFDPADQEFQLEEQRSQVREAELEIKKLEAEAAAQAAQDEVDLLTARFDVRKAELDVQGNELLGAIEARKRELTLEEAKRRLAQLEEDVQSRSTSSKASLAVALEKQSKARTATEYAQKLIDQMTLRASMDGLVAVRENRDSTFFWFPGMSFNEYREGDTVSSGSLVAEVLGPQQLELSARISETERARIAIGQKATVRMESVAGQPLTAKVSNVGGISGARVFFRNDQSPTRMFDATFALDQVPPTLRPGLTAELTIAGDPMKNVLFVPRQAVFDRNGKPTVFVKDGSGFVPRDVKVVARTASAVVVDQVAEGTEIALMDPTRKPGDNGPAPQAGAPTRMVGAR
jgi:multidrug resistance efflux pump